MNSWKIILATIVIFGAGVMTGGLLVNYVNHAGGGGHRPPGSFREPEDMIPRPDILKTNFVQRLDQAVHLSPEQRDKIQKIIAEGQQRNHDIWKLVSPQLRGVIQDVRHRIREELNPDQQKQFEELMKHVPRRPASATNAPPVSPPTSAPPVVHTNAPGA